MQAPTTQSTTEPIAGVLIELIGAAGAEPAGLAAWWMSLRPHPGATLYQPIRPAPLVAITHLDAGQTAQWLAEPPRPPTTDDSPPYTARVFQLTYWAGQPPDPTPPPAILVALSDLTPEEWVEEYEAWYRCEHFTLLTQIPGVRRARRYQRPGPRPRFLSLYDLDAPEVLFCAAHEAAKNTPWARRILPRFTPTYFGGYYTRWPAGGYGM